MAQLALAVGGAALGNALLPGIGFAAFGLDIANIGQIVGGVAGSALGATLSADDEPAEAQAVAHLAAPLAP